MACIVFHYRGELEDGSVFVDSREGEPFRLETGTHMVMPELEEALCAMKPGETNVVHVGKAYGDYDESALQTRILKSSIEDGSRLEEGMEVMWKSPQNPHKPLPARIARADEYSFDIDFNHPLAGKDLTYVVEVLNVS